MLILSVWICLKKLIIQLIIVLENTIITYCFVFKIDYLMLKVGYPIVIIKSHKSISKESSKHPTLVFRLLACFV